MINGNERLVNESFLDYKKRRGVTSKYLKLYVKGKMVWNSEKLGSYTKEKIALAVINNFMKGGK